MYCFLYASLATLLFFNTAYIIVEKYANALPLLGKWRAATQGRAETSTQAGAELPFLVFM